MILEAREKAKEVAEAWPKQLKVDWDCVTEKMADLIAYLSSYYIDFILFHTGLFHNFNCLQRIHILFPW